MKLMVIEITQLAEPLTDLRQALLSRILLLIFPSIDRLPAAKFTCLIRPAFTGNSEATLPVSADTRSGFQTSGLPSRQNWLPDLAD